MLENINLEEVKQYNATLKQYRDKAANINAEIEYTNKELDALCAELTAELGKQVTRDNIEQIYNEQVESIKSTLQSGNAVLAKIASEGEAQTMQVQTPVAQAVPSPVATPVAPQPVESVPVTPQPVPVAPQPVMASVANPFVNQATAQAVPNQLPPMFNLP